ncbi:hypothetical protein CJ178_24975 [Rhodococcus sp. ACPA4]|uniref:Uncharacterized protein n=1 Tax=Rhodococcus globerulus TaxID=33008 RepID=A0ABU4C0J2_RHOGO|nr:MULTISPECIES: hypothetical protein [Rhodococcus]MCE4264009.1 hypothetical protein [Rhodococcus globerulus]MDV6270002.1 hypothetical protein [Rhodococcus globerulus]NRI65391.1 hypothetical protein [Rhodococcus sp. MS16]PBC37356.1 hypothetical protein CJ178_24975 [Rhodococcus sp. ACPA4]RZL24808.1 MAG: hypothetical protein EOP31_14820 [Rhodococcus sp. (in: high G+C Gram-positive bacteria)]
MVVDLAAATRFLAGNGRILDRHRLNLVLGQGDRDAALAAVDGYRNPDGGYGWGLEPDLRSPGSQPGGALHAFEVFADVAAVTPRALELCDWLQTVSTVDGGLPFALPISEPAGCAPFWVDADPSESSLQITAIVCATALRVAEFDSAVAKHPWLDSAVRFCLGAIERAETLSALELAFALQFLDAANEVRLVAKLGALIPPDGLVHVDGGAVDEYMRPLDFSPYPSGPTRTLFSAGVIDEELSALAARQCDDGGWMVDFDSYSPAAVLEWRGHATVSAVALLKRNGVI